MQLNYKRSKKEEFIPPSAMLLKGIFIVNKKQKKVFFFFYSFANGSTVKTINKGSYRRPYKLLWITLTAIKFHQVIWSLLLLFRNPYPATLNIDLQGIIAATVTAISCITVGSSHLVKYPISMLCEHLIKTNVLQIYIGDQQPSKSLLWLGESMQQGG